MSLQRFEGFDHFDDTGPVPADFLAKGMSTSSGTILSYSAGKFSGFAVGLANTAYSFAIPYTTAVTESFIGFWFKATTLPAGSAKMVDYHSADTNATIPHVTLYLKSDGALEMRQAATVLVTTPASTVTAGGWVHIEVRLICNNSTGVVDIHVGGASVASGTSLTTTTATSSDYAITSVRFFGADTLAFLYDDFFLVDTTATSGHPVTFLGPCSVGTLFPNADGTTNNFVGVGAGSANYDRVNQVAPDYDASYVRQSTAGSLDLYAMDAIPAALAGSIIIGVQTASLVRKNTSGTKTARTRVLSGVAVVNGATTTLPDGYQYLKSGILVVDPSTATAWDFAGVNAVECGLELVT